MPDPQIESGEFSTLIVSVLCCSFKKKNPNSHSDREKVSNELSVGILCRMPHRDGQQGFILMNPYLFQDLFFFRLARLGHGAGLDA